MTAIKSIVLEAPEADTDAANALYASAWGLDKQVVVRPGDAPTAGFRGYTLSLIASQPADVDALVNAAVDAGATVIKPVSKSLWGYGGSVRTPDGAVWTIASSSKKNTAPASKKIDDIVLLLGVEDVAATKQFYVDRGLSVGRSFGRKYVEFTAPAGQIKLALNGRKALAKNAGVSPEGSGSHRIVVNGDTEAFTDLDGFTWDVAPA